MSIYSINTKFFLFCSCYHFSRRQLESPVTNQSQQDYNELTNIIDVLANHTVKDSLQGATVNLSSTVTATSTAKTIAATCLNQERRNIVLIKVHKAASTTAVAIIERYGYKHNMTLAVKAPTRFGPHILSSSGKFQRKMVHQWQRGYNLLTNHVRYNRTEMNAVVPNATYVTIIRDPVKHFESAFSYFLVPKHLDIHGRPDPMAAFFEQPEEYLKQKFYFWFQLRSGQIFDLGLDHVDHTGAKVAALIQHVRRHFDLVMLADHFDESLLLLRKHLCLDWRDILYILDNFRTAKQKMNISEEVRKHIEVWNWADMTLYHHFLHVFWDKVRDYGAGFQEDLAHFRRLLDETRDNCTTGRITRKAHDAHGVRTLQLRKDASGACKDLLLGDVDYTRMFRERQDKYLYDLPKHWVELKDG